MYIEDERVIVELYASRTTESSLGFNLFAYVENNPVVNIDPSGYCLADANGDGMNPSHRPKCGNAYDNKRYEWYVHPMYTNQNTYYEIAEHYNKGPYEYNGQSYYSTYTALFYVGLACSVAVLYFKSDVLFACASITTVAAQSILEYDEKFRDDPDVYFVEIKYSERYDVTRITLTFYMTDFVQGSIGLSYIYVGNKEYYIYGYPTERDINNILEGYN